MKTIEKIKVGYEIAISKLKTGDILTEDDRTFLEIGGRLYGDYAGNSGKRKVIKTGK